MITILSSGSLSNFFCLKKNLQNGYMNQEMQVQLQGTMLFWIAERMEVRNQVLLGKKLEASIKLTIMLL